jgi:hypothetical protein
VDEQEDIEFAARVSGAEFAERSNMEHRIDAPSDRRLSLWRQAIGDTTLPTHDEIAARAHAIYLQRGGTGGSDLNDWLQAERDYLFARTWGFQAPPPTSARDSAAPIHHDPRSAESGN